MFYRTESSVIWCAVCEQFGLKTPFLWRLIRAYGDAHDVAPNVQEKKNHAAAGESQPYNSLPCEHSHSMSHGSASGRGDAVVLLVTSTHC